MSVVCRLTEGPIRPVCGKRKHMTGTKPNTLLSITLPQQSPTSLTHIHNHYKYWCRLMGVYGEQSDMWNIPTTNFLKGVGTYLFIIIYFCLKIAEITHCTFKSCDCAAALWVLTIIIILWRAVVWFVDCCPEALVAATPSHHVWAGPVEGQQLVPLGLCHGGLKTL